MQARRDIVVIGGSTGATAPLKALLAGLPDGLPPQDHHKDPVAGSGYGRKLIEQALPYALNAKTTYEIHDDSLRCTIRLPLRGGARELA